MTDRELIEEAAKAIWMATDALTWENTTEDLRDSCRVEARAALSVFEKAQGEPSDAQVSAFFDRFNQRRDETWWEAAKDSLRVAWGAR